MIFTEITVVLVSFAFGLAAGAVSSALNVIGRGSGAARAVTDALIPLVNAAALFFGLFISAGGEFRLYALVAFAGGALLSAKVCARIYHALKPILRRMARPLISLERKLERKIKSAMAPALNKAAEKRKIALEMRAARKKEAAERKNRSRAVKAARRKAKARERARENAERRAGAEGFGKPKRLTERIK